MSGRYLVIAECIDSRSGKRFKKDEEFLPEPTVEQALHLVKAGCLYPIPESAPALPGGDAKTIRIADLESIVGAREKTIVELRGTIAANTIKASGEYNVLKSASDAAHEAHRKLSEEFQSARDKILEVEKARDDLRGERDGLVSDKNTLTARVAELEAQLAPKDEPGADQSQADAPPAQVKSAKTPKGA